VCVSTISDTDDMYDKLGLKCFCCHSMSCLAPRPVCMSLSANNYRDHSLYSIEESAAAALWPVLLCLCVEMQRD
jgi:hypothetical protein